MPSWRNEYAASLRDVDLSNTVNMELIQTCSHMADRITALEAENTLLQSRQHSNKSSSRSKSKPHTQQQQQSTYDEVSINQLRLDLAEALRSQATTESRLTTAEQDLNRTKSRTKDDAKTIRSLETELASVKTKFRDLEHELKEMRKLSEQFQDDILTLNLEVAIVQKERDKAKAENRELVARWMRRMEQEVDAMNLANEPHLDNGRGRSRRGA